MELNQRDIQQISKTQQFFIRIHDTFLAQHGLIAYIPILVATICMFFGTSWQIFLPTTDPGRYQCYALTFWLGSHATTLLPSAQCSFLPHTSIQSAFHMLPVEYPPLTLLVFSVALFAPLAYYQLVFAFFMSLVSILIYGLLLHYGPRGSALIYALYITIGAIATAQIRFDLLPALFTLICLIAAERRHWTMAYIALALAILLKLYPLLLLPALFVAEQRSAGRLYLPSARFSWRALPEELWRTLRDIRRWRWQRSGLCLGLIALVTGLFALLNFQGAVIDQLAYFLQRPIQAEAAGSTILRLASHLGIPFTIDNHYGSLNIISNLGSSVGFGFTLFLLLGILASFWLQWRGRIDLTQTSIALLLVFIATGKVFSPQYLIWLIPLLAYAGAFNVSWLTAWSAISLITTYIFAYLYSRPVTNLNNIPFTPGFLEAVTLRNGLFLLLTLAYLLNWFQLRQRHLLPNNKSVHSEAAKKEVLRLSDAASLSTTQTIVAEPLAKPT